MSYSFHFQRFYTHHDLRARMFSDERESGNKFLCILESYNTDNCRYFFTTNDFIRLKQADSYSVVCYPYTYLPAQYTHLTIDQYLVFNWHLSTLHRLQQLSLFLSTVIEGFKIQREKGDKEAERVYQIFRRSYRCVEFSWNLYKTCYQAFIDSISNWSNSNRLINSSRLTWNNTKGELTEWIDSELWIGKRSIKILRYPIRSIKRRNKVFYY